MSHPVNYTVHTPWLTAQTNHSNRPFTTITVFGPTGQSMSLWGLLDTGADYLMLERAVATTLGIDLTHCPTIAVDSACGTVSTLPLCDVDVELFGRTGRVPAVFGTKGTPLIGRTTILAFEEFGLGHSGWLRT